MRRRIWQSNLTGYFIIGAIILFAFIVCGSSLYSAQLSLFFRGLEPSCSLSMGTATITVQAWSANDDCQAMQGNPHNFTGVNWGALLSPVSGPNMNGDVICEMDISGRHITVRDNSSNGAIACGMLNTAQFGQ